jgi:hypothetical protein
MKPERAVPICLRCDNFRRFAAELHKSLRQKSFDRFLRRAQILSVRAISRGLHREDEVAGRLVAPLDPARRLEGGVVGAVDLDRCEGTGREMKLLLLRQAIKIE